MEPVFGFIERNLAILFGGVSNLQIRVSALSSNRDLVTLTLWPICSLAGRRDEHRIFWRRIGFVAPHVCVHTYLRQGTRGDTDAAGRDFGK
jgi:hypothetical protein